MVERQGDKGRNDMVAGFALTVSCASRRDIVASIASYLARMGCNITDSAQFDDRETGRFFMRMSFLSEEGQPLRAIEQGFAEFAIPIGIDNLFHDESRKMKVI
ncbi:MAG: hypothetical protein ACK5PF_03795, partial [bacterium]